MSASRKRMKRLREYYNFRRNLFDAVILRRKILVLYYQGIPVGIHDRTDDSSLNREKVLWYHGSFRSTPVTKRNYVDVPIEEIAAIVRRYFENYLHVKPAILDAIENGEFVPDNLTTRIKYHAS